VIYIDPPRWPGRGRLWSHLISDVSYAELHVFAEALGVPRRAFERDHYDVPEQRFRPALWLGAVPVPSREIVRLLYSAGLRRRRAGAPTGPAGSAGATGPG
jgi:uncharacterized protein DUF4031